MCSDRVPVDQPLTAVDETFFMQFDEDFLDGGRQPVVHSEAFVLPVDRCAQASRLLADLAARFIFPLPDPLDEFIAPEIAPRSALVVEKSLDDHLRRYAGMVHARLPQCAAASHTMVADQGILNRVAETVAHVQGAGYVWRRNHDAVTVAIALWCEVPVFFPTLVNALFDFFWLIRLVHQSLCVWIE